MKNDSPNPCWSIYVTYPTRRAPMNIATSAKGSSVRKERNSAVAFNVDKRLRKFYAVIAYNWLNFLQTTAYFIIVHSSGWMYLDRASSSFMLYIKHKLHNMIELLTYVYWLIKHKSKPEVETEPYWLSQSSLLRDIWRSAAFPLSTTNNEQLRRTYMISKSFENFASSPGPSL